MSDEDYISVRYGAGKIATVPRELGDVLKALQGQRLLLLVALKHEHANHGPFRPCNGRDCACALIRSIESA